MRKEEKWSNSRYHRNLLAQAKTIAATYVFLYYSCTIYSNISRNINTLYYVQVTQNLTYINPAKAKCESTLLLQALQYLKELFFFKLPIFYPLVLIVTVILLRRCVWSIGGKMTGEKGSTWSKTCPIVTLSTKNIMWLPGLHLPFWCETLAINHLSYSMANFRKKLIYITYTDSVCTLQTRQCAFIRKISQWMQYREMISIYFQTQKEYINTVSGHNTELLAQNLVVHIMNTRI